jgi:hypothetical protein
MRNCDHESLAQVQIVLLPEEMEMLLDMYQREIDAYNLQLTEYCKALVEVRTRRILFTILSYGMNNSYMEVLHNGYFDWPRIDQAAFILRCEKRLLTAKEIANLMIVIGGSSDQQQLASKISATLKMKSDRKILVRHHIVNGQVRFGLIEWEELNN